MTPHRPATPLGRNPDSPEWCQVCCVRHSAESVCAGDYPAIGPERPGWKALVETPNSILAYQVLLAPLEVLWRARIQTCPNTIWSVPGGRGAMKFVGRTPQSAEEQAIRFIEEFCALRGFLLRSGLELATNVAPRRTAEPVKPEAPKPAGPLRRPVVVPCQYAVDDQLARAVTRNVSETGVFIQTPAPAQSGVALRLELMIHAAPMALRGVVVWMRRNADTGRPPGMGVRLAGPPKDYLEFVRSLPAPAAA